MNKFTLNDVTVVICNWLQVRMTLGAVTNIRRYYPKVKIIVVDNGSSENDTENFFRYYGNWSAHILYDNDVKKLKKASKDLNFKIIELENNLDHGSGMDYGLDNVKTRLILTMDSDIRLLAEGKNLINEYLEKLNEDPKNIYAVGTTWEGNEYFRKWIALWFSLFQVYPIKKWHLTFKNIVFPVHEHLHLKGDAFHCELALLIHTFLTTKYPPMYNPMRAVYYPNPEAFRDKMAHLKLRTEGFTKEQKESFFSLIDG